MKKRRQALRLPAFGLEAVGKTTLVERSSGDEARCRSYGRPLRIKCGVEAIAFSIFGAYVIEEIHLGTDSYGENVERPPRGRNKRRRNRFADVDTKSRTVSRTKPWAQRR